MSLPYREDNSNLVRDSTEYEPQHFKSDPILHLDMTLKYFTVLHAIAYVNTDRLEDSLEHHEELSVSTGDFLATL